MLNATTSPLYAICVSNDVAVDMMATSGEVLTQEVIDEAIDFRQALASMYREFKKEKTWFFKPWNAEKVYDERRKRHYDFADAPKELLAYSQSCWKLNSKDKWHGFTDIEDDWAMLDPIKVSILSPGINLDGTFEDMGVPAELVASYLYYHGIIPTRSTDFQLMFLFSMGITKGKWGTLLNTLLNFKEHYDNNAPISEVLPELAKDYPEIYGEMGVKDLGDEMFDYIKRENPTAKLNSAFAELPEIVMLPRDAYNKIVKKEVELIPSSKLAWRIAANSLIPYPPGIPLIMSGERFGDSNSVQIEYLKALEKWDSTFPGFEHETEGAEKINGEYCVLCIKE
jgi:arginine decarboxylase